MKVHNCHNDNTIFNTRNWVEYTDEVKEALEKQMPEKVIVSQYIGTSGVPYKSCPRCNNLVWGSQLDEEFKYCPDCGQRLDWTD